MKLRTEYTIPPASLQLKHEDEVLLYGSCFAENIGEKLQKLKYRASINPLGISYNPISLHTLLSLTKEQLLEKLETNNQDKGVFFHWDFHSALNHINQSDFKAKLNNALEAQIKKLKQSKVVFISYGTAWVHELKSNQKTVNNCHKQPSSLFEKRLLSVDEIVKSWQKTENKLQDIYQTELQFVFTVSPVRHLKDGFRENQLSKSTLQLAIEKIVSNSNHSHYFPSYELMIDDLRDYRFYTEDLLHPNSIAIEYLWEKFSGVYLNEEEKKLNQKIEKLITSANHRPFQLKSEAHQSFLKKLKKEIQEISQKYNLDFNPELQLIDSQMV